MAAPCEAPQALSDPHAVAGRRGDAGRRTDPSGWPPRTPPLPRSRPTARAARAKLRAGGGESRAATQGGDAGRLSRSPPLRPGTSSPDTARSPGANTPTRPSTEAGLQVPARGPHRCTRVRPAARTLAQTLGPPSGPFSRTSSNSPRVCPLPLPFHTEHGTGTPPVFYLHQPTTSQKSSIPHPQADATRPFTPSPGLCLRLPRRLGHQLRRQSLRPLSFFHLPNGAFHFYNFFCSSHKVLKGYGLT